MLTPCVCVCVLTPSQPLIRIGWVDGGWWISFPPSAFALLASPIPSTASTASTASMTSMTSTAPAQAIQSTPNQYVEVEWAEKNATVVVKRTEVDPLLGTCLKEVVVKKLEPNLHVNGVLKLRLSNDPPVYLDDEADLNDAWWRAWHGKTLHVEGLVETPPAAASTREDGTIGELSQRTAQLNLSGNAQASTSHGADASVSVPRGRAVILMKQSAGDWVRNDATELPRAKETVSALKDRIVTKYSGAPNPDFKANGITVYACKDPKFASATTIWKLLTANVEETWKQFVNDKELDPMAQLESGHCYLVIVDSRMPMLDKAMETFLLKLLSCAIQGDGFLPISTPSISPHPRGLFFRDCYPRLWKKIQEVVARRSNRLALLTGTPGIGKSIFVFYMIRELVQTQRKTVILQYARRKTATVLSPGTVYDIKTGQIAVVISRLLPETSVWHLLDGMVPHHGIVTPVLVVSSPRGGSDERGISEYKKHASVLWMPLWRREELLKCRECCFPDIPEETVVEAIEHWGCIPRFVLDPTSNLSRLEDAIQTAREDLVDFNGESAAPYHKLLHTDVDDTTFTNPHLAFASDYVCNSVAKRVVHQGECVMETFLAAAAGKQTFATARGYIHEKYSHTQLLMGGRFTIRRLLSGDRSPLPAVEALEVAHSTEIGFDNLTDLEGVKGMCYAKPNHKNFAAVDSFLLQTDCAFQMTVSSTHPIKAKALDDVLAHLHPRQGSYRLFFVVPSDVFDAMKSEQSYTTERNAPYKGSLPRRVQQVDQYVLMMHYGRGNR